MGVLVGVALIVGLIVGLLPCGNGFTGMGLGNCEDIDECAEETHHCHKSATCSNTVGAWLCTCNMGHDGNGKDCEDINECELGFKFEKLIRNAIVSDSHSE